MLPGQNWPRPEGNIFYICLCRERIKKSSYLKPEGIEYNLIDLSMLALAQWPIGTASARLSRLNHWLYYIIIRLNYNLNVGWRVGLRWAIQGSMAICFVSESCVMIKCKGRISLRFTKLWISTGTPKAFIWLHWIIYQTVKMIDT